MDNIFNSITALDKAVGMETGSDTTTNNLGKNNSFLYRTRKQLSIIKLILEPSRDRDLITGWLERTLREGMEIKNTALPVTQNISDERMKNTYKDIMVDLTRSRSGYVRLNRWEKNHGL